MKRQKKEVSQELPQEQVTEPTELEQLHELYNKLNELGIRSISDLENKIAKLQ